jgi:hypothetical protein
VRRPLRIVCGVLGGLLVAAAFVVAAGEPNPWLSLAPMAAGLILLMPAFAARRAASDEEAELAMLNAWELSDAGRALLVPGLLGLVVAKALEGSRPGFSLVDDPVGAMAAVLIAALIVGGVGCAIGAVYYRAKALGR